MPATCCYIPLVRACVQKLRKLCNWPWWAAAGGTQSRPAAQPCGAPCTFSDKIFRFSVRVFRLAEWSGAAFCRTFCVAWDLRLPGKQDQVFSLSGGLAGATAYTPSTFQQRLLSSLAHHKKGLLECGKDTCIRGGWRGGGMKQKKVDNCSNFLCIIFHGKTGFLITCFNRKQ